MRLHFPHSYPSSEIKRIHAQARNHGLEAAITHAREKLYHITNRPYAADVDTLRLVAGRLYTMAMPSVVTTRVVREFTQAARTAVIT